VAEPKPQILVSGASGFIGRAVTRHLAASGCEVVVALRGPASAPAIPGAARAVTAGDLAAPDPALAAAMRGVAVVVHAAGRAHRTGVDPAALAAANVTAAARVAEIAASCGVGRFILVSSAAVHGKSPAGIITEAVPPAPDDEYAASKLEGEEVVRRVLAGSGTEVVIIRPCAVVGPGCAGNIPRLIRLIARAPVLPFGAVRNRRSFIAVDDLAGLIGEAARAERVPEILLAAHGIPISTPDLIRALARGCGRHVVLAPVPPAVLRAIAMAFGQSTLWQSFAGSLQADPALARDALGFTAATPIADILEATAQATVI